MMALTPPAGWGEVATKRDLDHLDGSLRSALDQHRAATDAAIAQLRAEFKDDLRQQTRTIMMSMLLMVIATAGLAFSAATLA
jgi:hypothetical protein